jgi:hypothetical protein
MTKMQALRNPMNHGMCDPLGSYQNQRDDRKRYLKEFRSALLRSYGQHAPLRRRPGAQCANAPYDVEVDQGAGRRRDHHRDPNHVPMKATRRCVDANRCLCKCTKTDGDTDTADGNDGRAGTLQNDKYQTRHANEPCPLTHGALRQNWFRIL